MNKIHIIDIFIIIFNNNKNWQNWVIIEQIYWSFFGTYINMLVCAISLLNIYCSVLRSKHTKINTFCSSFLCYLFLLQNFWIEWYYLWGNTINWKGLLYIPSKPTFVTHKAGCGFWSAPIAAVKISHTSFSDVPTKHQISTHTYMRHTCQQIKEYVFAWRSSAVPVSGTSKPASSITAKISICSTLSAVQSVGISWQSNLGICTKPSHLPW